MDPTDAPRAAQGRPPPRYAALGVIVAAAVAFTAAAAWAIRNHPDVVMLLPQDGAQWIKPPTRTVLRTIRPDRITTYFQAAFIAPESLGGATLRVSAFRSVDVMLDGRRIYSETLPREQWKRERSIPLPASLAPGPHVFLFVVSNDGGPPALRVSLPSVGLRSNPSWQCTADGVNWVSAWPVTWIRTPDLSKSFPTPFEQFIVVLPLLTIVCLAGALIAWYATAPSPWTLRLGRLLSPSRLRYLVLAVLFAMGLNSMMRAHLGVGADAPDHYDYIHWMTEDFGVPPPDGGRQFFQAPLFYAVAAVAHNALAPFLNDLRVDRALRLISVVSGLAMVELMFRLLRYAFPGRHDIQRIGLLTGAFIPLLIVKTQFIGNEPMAGALAAAAVLLTVRILQLPQCAGPWLFALLGLVWGLATLTKVSALVLAPAIALAMAFWMYSNRPSVRAAANRVGALAAAFALTCGWYFALNYVRYGKGFIGGWSIEVGYGWWQHPGYRTPEQYFQFGQALIHPVYASVFGFWDGIYSGLWFDMNLGALVSRIRYPMWGYEFSQAAVLWALVPTAAALAGAARAVLPLRRSSEGDAAWRANVTRIFCLWVVGAYGAAILGHSLLLPYYSPIKASYALAALPALVVLIASGLEPLTRTRPTRALLHAWLAGWLLLVCAGYWLRGA